MKNKVAQAKVQTIRFSKKAIVFISEVVEAALATLGLMQFIHTSSDNIQTGISIFFVLLLLITKFSNNTNTPNKK